jgi:GAF domain-containing protein
MSGSINLNLLLEMVVEGIHRGIGMDRTLFSLLSTDKKTLNEKLSLGWQKEVNAGKFKLDVSGISINLFFKAIQSSEGLWANPDRDSSLFTPQIINRIGKSECFVIPIHAENKPIGLIYTDRSINNKPLTEDDFKTAKHFTQQAIIGLALYKLKKQSPFQGH